MFRRKLQTLALAVVVTTLGVSFVLATPNTAPRSGDTVAPRVIGTGLRFSNPFLTAGQADPNYLAGGDAAIDPDGFDLGDIVNAVPVTRYLTGLGGVQPYTFTSTDAVTGIAKTGLKLDPDGRVTGTTDFPGTNPATSFTATITDQTGASRTGYFRLFNIPANVALYRFAQDRLSDAQVGVDYITNADLIGNLGTSSTFSVLAGATLNAVPIASLNEVGLQLYQDGTIAGRPLKTGTLVFTVHAVRNDAVVAKDRTNTNPDQTFTVNIAAQSDIQSVFATNVARMTLDTTHFGRDSLTYTTFINTNGRTITNFRNQPVTLRVGKKVFQTTLNNFGTSGGALRVSVDAPFGYVRVALTRQDFSTLLETPVAPLDTIAVVVIELQIGNFYLGAEPVQFNVRTRNGKSTLTYILGSKYRQLGGLFQIYSVQGRDNGANNKRTAFNVKFFLTQTPVTQGEDFGRASSADLAIGPGFTETLALNNGSGHFPPVGVINARIRGDLRVGQFTTDPLLSTDTGVARSVDSNGQIQTYYMGLKVTTDKLTFNGVLGRKLFPF